MHRRRCKLNCILMFHNGERSVVVVEFELETFADKNFLGGMSCFYCRVAFGQYFALTMTD